MAKVSILTAARHAEATILEAVHGVLAQNHGEWEQIIASDDGTDYVAYCRHHGIDDPRLRGADTGADGAGPARARNAALAAACGNFVVALDADDRWAPEKLEVLLLLAEERGIAVDNTRAVTPEGQAVGTAFPGRARTFSIGPLDVVDCPMPLFPLIRRDLAGDGYPEWLDFAEDVVFNMTCAVRAGGITTTARSYTDYVQWPESACNRPGAWKVAERAYGQILERLEAGCIDLPAGLSAAAAAGFAKKRQLNLAFGEAQARGQAVTFQEFLNMTANSR